VPDPTGQHYDALVVGSGPAGSVAALVLARGGASVALVDKANFPRDKACGDLVGPRGVQTLTDLGVRLEGPRLGDMEVTGPTGRQVVLPAVEGLTYPGFAVVAQRARLDALLHTSALDGGAVFVTGRADTACYSDSGELRGFEVRDGSQSARITADVVIGADGALSRVGSAAGLVNDHKVIWGFAVRGYLPTAIDLPRIHFWEPARWSGYPGYGWVFPGDQGEANVGLGVAARGDRRAAARAVRDLPGFLSDAGLDPAKLGPTLGGWLKMGMIGTRAASGRALLVGDAAGLVNSLQGEGIAQALDSGRMAAEAVLKVGPSAAAALYIDELTGRYGPYAATTAPATSWMIEHPKAVAALGRFLTAPVVGSALAGGWALYWNDLVDGASPGSSRRVARLAEHAGKALTARSAARRDIESSLAPVTGRRSAGGGSC
jgi:geranylgeranyl reductase family protein